MVADVHPWAGGMLGAFGSPVAYGLLRQADMVLVLGSRLNPADTMMESPDIFSVDRQNIVQVDCVAEHLGRAIPITTGIVADIREFLDALLPEIGVDEAVVDSRWARLEALRSTIDDDTTVAVSSSPMRPQRVVGVLNDVLGERHRVVLDAGNNRIFHYRYLKLPTPGRLHMCGGHLGMGWGPSAAIGAALLRPDDRVVSIVGDGGMQMALPTLAFAAAHRLSVTFIVMNNGVLGNVLDAQKAGRYAIDLPPIDYTAVAQAFGLSAAPSRQRRCVRGSGSLRRPSRRAGADRSDDRPGRVVGTTTRSRLTNARRRQSPCRRRIPDSPPCAARRVGGT